MDKTQKLLPFFEITDQPPDDSIIHLDKKRLLEMLNNWESTQSLTQLRQEIGSLTSGSSQFFEQLTEERNNGNSVTIKRRHFIEDLEQIAASATLERALYYVNRLIKGFTIVKTSAINDINLNRWKEYEDILTDSLWMIDKRDSSGVHTANYWGNFIPQIPHQMMKRYTKTGEWVLDTFAGSGTTLIEGQRMGRNTIGIELQERMVQHTKTLIASEPNIHNVIIDVVQDDSTQVDYRSLLHRYDQESVQLVIMHPPYFDIIQFSDDPQDLSNAKSVDDFLEKMGLIVSNASRVLDKGRYLVVVIGDKYAGGEWIPLGFQTMNLIMGMGYSLKSIIVKNFEETSGKRNKQELWRYRALVGGFYIFKHEYIFLFQKG
ncbi:MAG: DNA methyltransferase [Anaerolineae bacterium]|nr:DNA methyltransferase [Anaerolineae bacterium]